MFRFGWNNRVIKVDTEGQYSRKQLSQLKARTAYMVGEAQKEERDFSVVEIFTRESGRHVTIVVKGMVKGKTKAFSKIFAWGAQAMLKPVED